MKSLSEQYAEARERWRGILWPDIFFWRRVETGNADLLEFHLGGGKFPVSLGILALATGCFGLWIGFHFSSMALIEAVGLFRFGNYRGAIFDYLAAGIPLIFLIQLSLGIWLIWRRAGLAIDKDSGKITKWYRMGFITVQATAFKFEKASSVSYQRDAHRLWICWSYSISLNDKSQNSIRLLTVPWGTRKKGRKMAGDIASFLGVPGPFA